MRPSWTVYGQFDGDVRDEEIFNDCLADLLADTLHRGPTFLNHLLDGLVEFNDKAQIEATDREPLPYRDNGTDRRIDITIGDDSKIVGFESKRRDSLSRDQLDDELEKLEYNAHGREVILLAITEDIREPALVESYPDTIRWTSWFRLSQQVYRSESLGEGWQPTVSRAKKMFREFGYEGFDGIDTEEFRVSVWELWKQVASQTEGLDAGERWPYKNIRTVQGTSNGWKPIDPDWMLLTFSDGVSGDHSETCYTLLSNKKTKEITIGLSLRPWGNEDLQEFMNENSDVLADRVIEEDMEVVQFPLNWLVGRKTLPKGHRKAKIATHPSSREELVAAFSDKKGMKNDGANRFILGYSVDVEEPLADSVEQIARLQDIFATDTGPELQQLLDDENGSNTS